MEPMDTSLDKFYKMVYDNDETIPEEVLGKIAVAVSRRLKDTMLDRLYTIALSLNW